jgi:tetratricopeptide (TPR) repeat protein
MILLFLFIGTANAGVVTFVKEYTYQASEIDSKVSCRTIALEQVKRLLLEELGVYLESKTEVVDFLLTRDQITTLSAGIVSAVIINEKWDGTSFFMKAKITADPTEVAKSIDKLRNDTEKTKELEELKKLTNNYAKEIDKLKKELAKAKIENPNQHPTTTTIKEYNATIEKMSAADLYARGLKLTFTPGKTNEAIDLFTEAININPKYVAAYIARGRAYNALNHFLFVHNKYSNKGIEVARKNNLELALKDFNRAIELDSQSADAYQSRGAAYVQLDNDQAALKDFNKSIDIDPKNIGAYIGIGTMYNKKGKKQLAIDEYTKAIDIIENTDFFYPDGKKKEKPPTLFLCYNFRAALYAALGRYQQAIEDYDKIIKLRPKLSVFYYSRGSAYSALGDKQKALDDYKIAAKLGVKQAQNILNKQGIAWQ